MKADGGYRKDGSPLNRTDAALIGRGIDSVLAASLRAKKWTLAKLKEATDNKLKSLGLPPAAIDRIRSGPRSEIPFDSVAKVLIANRFMCCVCRDPAESVVVHHIEEWSVSHSHAPKNLCVICVRDHVKAHTKSELTRNLTPALLRKAKTKWEDEVRARDTYAIIEASRTNSDAWLYFNHMRLFELARSLRIDLKKVNGYKASLRAAQIDGSGTLKKRARSHGYMYEGGDGTTLYRYVRDVWEEVLNRITVLNVSDLLDRGLLAAVAKPGDIILLQGLTSFSQDRKGSEANGPGQSVIGVRKVNRVTVRFSIDRWEATSNSARTVWLRGSSPVAAVVRLVKFETTAGKALIHGTALAIAHGFDEMKMREYANMPFRRGVVFDAYDEDEVDDSWLSDHDE